MEDIAKEKEGEELRRDRKEMGKKERTRKIIRQ